MTGLAVPTLERYDAWAACVEEFGDAHVGGSGHEGPMDASRGAFTAYVADRLAQEQPDFVPPPGRVPCTFRWIVDGPCSGVGDVVGFLAIRHRLNDFLLEQGGHVGYAVRPSRRRQGHASRALRLAVGLCADLGIAEVLVTCDDDNVGSRRTIERNGGVLEDVRRSKRRYWIESARVVAPGALSRPE